MTNDVQAASDAQWQIWMPPGADDLRPEGNLLPCEVTSDPQNADQLVIVVATAADLTAAREVMLQNAAQRVVLWAWWLPEILAIEAEDLAPTVYEVPLSEDFDSAWEKGSGATKQTRMLADLEQAFGFDPSESMPAL